jgi:SRSO17 transposase
MDQAGVPAAERRSLTKPQIARELLDRVRAEGRPGSVVVADAGDGVSRDLRDGRAARGRSDIVGVTADSVVFPAPPTGVAPKPSTGGRPQTRYQLAEGNPLPVRVGELAGRMNRRKGTWREGTKGKLAARFAGVRVGPGHDWRRGGCATAAPVWWLIEEQTDGQLKFAVSNLPAKTNRRAAVRRWKSRWPVEQGYPQLKDELGLDHFEGRSWRGFHHPAAMTFLADGFLLLEERLTPPALGRRGKKGARG